MAMARSFSISSTDSSASPKKLGYDFNDEINHLMEEANKKVTHAEQFCSALDDIKQTYKGHFEHASVGIDIDEEKSTLQSNKEKLDRNNLYFSVCGSTSAGKSTMVNALLGKPLIQSSANRCTPCCILVQTTNEMESYFCIDDDKKEYPLELLREKADKLLSGPTDKIDYKTIRVYVSKQEENFEYFDLNNAKISLMDTPGCDQPEFKANEQIIMGSDVFVFVVDAVTGFNDEMKTFFSRVVQQYSLKNVLIVFNKWDLVYLEGQSRADTVENSYRKEAERFFLDLGLADDSSSVMDNIYFFSSVHVKLMRQCDSYKKVRKCLTKTCVSMPTDVKHQIFVCGGASKGRSTVVNMLLDEELLPTEAAETPSFISFERDPAESDKSWIEAHEPSGRTERYKRLEDLEWLGKRETVQIPITKVHVYFDESMYTRRGCILSELDVRLYDTPHPKSENFERIEGLMQANSFTLIIVISGRRSRADNLETFEDCIKPLKSLGKPKYNIIVIVNKWDVAIDQQTKGRLDETKNFYIDEFIKCCKDFQSESDCRERIFFVSLKDFKRNTHSQNQFIKFSEKLLKTGTDNFKETKFEPIFQALESCSQNLLKCAEETEKKLMQQNEVLFDLKATVDEFSFPTENGHEMPFSDEYLSKDALSPVSIFLEHNQGDSNLPNDNHALKETVTGFLDFCDERYLDTKKGDIRSSVLKSCSESPEKYERLKKIFLVPDTAVRRSSVTMRENIPMVGGQIDRIITQESLSRQIGVGWNTLELSVVGKGVIPGAIVAGIITTGVFLNSMETRSSRLMKLCISATVGAGIMTVVNSFRHLVFPLRKRQREVALRKLLISYYIIWFRDIQTQTKRKVSQYYTELCQSLQQASRQLESHKDRFNRRLIRSKEERLISKKND